jgi:hypothetical protein
VSSVQISTSQIGNALQELLMAGNIQPGDAPSYQICKTIYAYHPLGSKMVDAPIKMAMAQKREISITDASEDIIREAFEEQWKKDEADKSIAQLASIARIYGVGSIIVGAKDIDPSQEIPPEKYSEIPIYFNVLDPLNTAGSLVLNQDPNAPDFQKHRGVSVAGQPYHRSRSVTLMNEAPVYIEYTNSAFGFVGRSVYQRALFPLKSFVQTMIADDVIACKNAVLVAKMKGPGSVINNMMAQVSGIKRALLQEAKNTNVINIDVAEAIETLDMNNVDGSGTFARTNILKNIATAADMPAKLLENETMVAGFGEGSEDAKHIAKYLDSIREWMSPAYDFFDQIIMRRAWNPDFFEVVKAKYPEKYDGMEYNTAFQMWRNSFQAVWPNPNKDPEIEVKMEETRQKAVLSMLEILMPTLDKANKARVIQWAIENAGENKLLFPMPLVLDYEELEAHMPDGMPYGDNDEHEPHAPGVMSGKM